MKVTLRSKAGNFYPDNDAFSRRLATRLTAVDEAAGGISTHMRLV